MAVDLKRQLAACSARRGVFDVVEVPPTGYLAVDGHGGPNTSPVYRDAVAALYPMAYRMTGRHHEIYLGDVRRAAPESLRTILRQPVARL